MTKPDFSKVKGDFQGKASILIMWYLKKKPFGYRFMAENVREWAIKEYNWNPPEDLRAWGNVIRWAYKQKWIRHCGYEKQNSVNCHGSPKSVWCKA